MHTCPRAKPPPTTHTHNPCRLYVQHTHTLSALQRKAPHSKAGTTKAVEHMFSCVHSQVCRQEGVHPNAQQASGKARVHMLYRRRPSINAHKRWVQTLPRHTEMGN